MRDLLLSPPFFLEHHPRQWDRRRKEKRPKMKEGHEMEKKIVIISIIPNGFWFSLISIDIWGMKKKKKKQFQGCFLKTLCCYLLWAESDPKGENGPNLMSFLTLLGFTREMFVCLLEHAWKSESSMNIKIVRIISVANSKKNPSESRSRVKKSYEWQSVDESGKGRNQKLEFVFDVKSFSSSKRLKSREDIPSLQCLCYASRGKINIFNVVLVVDSVGEN